ncbi:phage tail tape measure protein, TP901 family, core region [Lachnospiraceae bacterium 10-1]|nr:phage tail tape measure protein, TP901 family, core region [Lachnospiraceae bacterium 10-1]
MTAGVYFFAFFQGASGLLFFVLWGRKVRGVASRIQGITVEIGGDTTKLTTALKSVNTDIRTTQSQLRDVNNLLKLDPGNTELLAQKHRLLADAVRETKEKLETLKAAAEQANEALAKGEITQEQYDGLQREIIETEEKLKSLEEQANQSAVAVQKIAAVGEDLKNLGDKISGVGTTLTKTVTTPIVGLGTVAVKTAADFDSAMSQVGAVSGATGKDLDALRDKAREMGSKTKFSASEAAEAMNYMAMAGWKTSDMLSGIEGIMNLAAASGEDLASTSDIVTDALTAFGLTAADSGHFADILAAASSNANTNVSMMGETFKYCAPIAGALGFSAEDTAEAIGLMGNAGIKSTQAGTALRTIMSNLSGEVKICGSSIGEVTIATTNADGSMRDLSAILADCRTAFGGLSESEKAAAAEALVGKNAMSGFLALMNAAPADIEKVSSAIANCDGKSAEMAATMQDNLAGQLTILKSQLEELAISFGEILMPAIRQIVTWVQGFVDKLNGMDEGTKNTIVTIGLLAAAIGPVLIIIGKVVSAVGSIMTFIPTLIGGISSIGGGLSALWGILAANPVTLVIAAIAALIAIFVALWNNCEGFREFWINLWNVIKEAAVAVWNGLKDFFSNIWNAITGAAQAIWNGLKDFFSGLWEGIKNIFQTVLDVIKTLIVARFEFYKLIITTVLNVIQTVVSTVWNAIKSVIETVTNAIGSFLSSAWETIKSAITTAMEAIRSAVIAAWEAIKSAVSSAIEAIKNVAVAAWEAIKSAVISIMEAIKSAITAAWEAIKSAVSSVVGAIKEVITSVWNAIKSTVTSIVGGLKDAVVNVFNSLLSGIKNAMSGIAGAVKSGFEAAINFIKGLPSQALQWGKDIIGGLIDGIKSKISGLVDSVKDVAGTIASFLHFSEPDEGPLSNFHTFMPDMIDLLGKGIKGNLGKLTGPMKELASTLIPATDSMTAGAQAAGGSGGSSSLAARLDAMYEVVTKYLPRLANSQVVLDSGVLVGELSDGLNRELGKAYS